MNRIIIRDFLLLFCNILLALLVAAILAITQQHQKDGDGSIASPGQLAVYISWPEGDVDVDLHLMGPKEKFPVYYLHPNGENWDLLRDDRGNNDTLPTNFENGYTRNNAPGLYVVNLHCFRCYKFPVEVTVELRDQDDQGIMQPVATTKVLLEQSKQERTAFQFIVGKDGHVKKDTVVKVFRPLLDQEIDTNGGKRTD